MANETEKPQENASRFRRWMKRILYLAGALFLLWLVLVVGLVIAIHQYGQREHPVAAADAIIVLGAGLRRDGAPGFALTRRSSRAADLWREGVAARVICTGAQADGYPRSEAEGCRDVLLRRGLPPEAIVLETRSRSTEENALYSREIMDEQGWKTAVIVSDSYHVLRASWIFGMKGMTVQVSPVPSQLIRGQPSYSFAVLREILAFHWQFFKELFQLDISHVYAL